MASIVDDRELDRRVHRALAAIRDLPAVQRDIVVERILSVDPELGSRSSDLLAAFRNARPIRFGLIRRDSLTD